MIRAPRGGGTGLQSHLVTTLWSSICSDVQLVPVDVLCAFNYLDAASSHDDKGSVMADMIGSRWHLFGWYSSHAQARENERVYLVTSVPRLRGWIKSRMVEYGY